MFMRKRLGCSFRATVLLQIVQSYCTSKILLLVCRLTVMHVTTCMLKFCGMNVYLLKFGEISANIPETVQDEDIVTVED